MRVRWYVRWGGECEGEKCWVHILMADLIIQPLLCCFGFVLCPMVFLAFLKTYVSIYIQ